MSAFLTPQSKIYLNYKLIFALNRRGASGNPPLKCFQCRPQKWPLKWSQEAIRGRCWYHCGMNLTQALVVLERKNSPVVYMTNNRDNNLFPSNTRIVIYSFVSIFQSITLFYIFRLVSGQWWRFVELGLINFCSASRSFWNCG